MRKRSMGDAVRAGDPQADLAALGGRAPPRRERLYVADEVEIALKYLRDVFLPVLPLLYARWERLLPHRPKSFLRLGSWIGGDRDGNPNVTADSLRIALGSASQAVLESYLDQIHTLGSELSISTELSKPTDESRDPGGQQRRHHPLPQGRALPSRPDRLLRAARCDIRALHGPPARRARPA